MRKEWMNSYFKFGGAARRHFSAICEKPMGGGGTYVPPGRARVKCTSLPNTTPRHIKSIMRVWTLSRRHESLYTRVPPLQKSSNRTIQRDTTGNTYLILRTYLLQGKWTFFSLGKDSINTKKHSLLTISRHHTHLPFHTSNIAISIDMYTYASLSLYFHQQHLPHADPTEAAQCRSL